MKRPKILHAPAIIINQQWVISRAQRKLGYRSDCMAFNADRKEFRVRNCDYNFHFDRNEISFHPKHILWTLKFLVQFTAFFISALFRYDVFHFHSESFLGSKSSLDLKILKLLPIPIFMVTIVVPMKHLKNSPELKSAFTLSRSNTTTWSLYRQPGFLVCHLRSSRRIPVSTTSG